MKWTDLRWFNANTSNTEPINITQVVDVGELGTATTPWLSQDSASGSSSNLPESSTSDSVSTPPSGGTGSTPTILIGVDYYLRDVDAEIITDSADDYLSLEGLNLA